MKPLEQVQATKRQLTPQAETVLKVLNWSVGGTIMASVVTMGVLHGINQAKPEYRIAGAIEHELTGAEGTLDKSVYDIGYAALMGSVERKLDTDDYTITVSPSDPPEFMGLPPRLDLQLKAEVTGTWDADDMFIPIPGLAGEVTLSPANEQSEQLLSAYSQNS